ncbi:hypothetical protein FISHEDRAFT_71976 [Fistulina hepatica ATCC 64428]|uniref:YCII-related domain-containing protein n=1 Tax=Fistulina hepatica ATCC 64428 TaxID=1128425 RepID=A0A0D7AHR2_9AGAR|nr:hypothetical protein FISHEDRAFT_71976 [Fistulina hepatica ATCC 64428]
MSTATTPAKYRFLVYAPDAPGMAAKRMEVRPTHVEGLQKNVKDRFVRTSMSPLILPAGPRSQEASLS